jgi:DNA polymerase III subunit delta'
LADTPEPDRFEGAPHPRETRVLFGQHEAERGFLDAYRSGRMPHAWLFGGELGIGKATLAYRAARFVLVHPDPQTAAVRAATDLSVDPNHPAARRVEALSHRDLVVLRREYDAEKKRVLAEISIDKVRAALHVFSGTSAEGGWRVAILDSAEDLNRNSANALLKIVEEPPARALFLIVAHRPGAVMPTIRSRVRRLPLVPLGAAEVASAVHATGLAADDALIARAAALSGGSVRSALKLLDEHTLAVVEHIRRMLDSLPDLDRMDLHRVAEGLTGRANEADFETALETIQGWLSGEAHARAGEAAGRLAPLAEVWDKIARAVREATIYNLDRRALVLGLFSDLAEAVRGSRAA